VSTARRVPSPGIPQDLLEVGYSPRSISWRPSLGSCLPRLAIRCRWYGHQPESHFAALLLRGPKTLARRGHRRDTGDATTGVSVFTAAGIGAGNTLEAVLGACSCGRVGFQPPGAAARRVRAGRARRGTEHGCQRHGWRTSLMLSGVLLVQDAPQRLGNWWLGVALGMWWWHPHC